MYNRYIPNGAVYTRVTMDDEEPRRREQAVSHTHPREKDRPAPQSAHMGRMEGAQSSLNGLISSLGLEKLDSGDLLLFLILLLLLKEGDDLEMMIALGLTLLMGLGDDKGK